MCTSVPNSLSALRKNKPLENNQVSLATSCNSHFFCFGDDFSYLQIANWKSLYHVEIRVFIQELWIFFAFCPVTLYTCILFHHLCDCSLYHWSWTMPKLLYLYKGVIYRLEKLKLLSYRALTFIRSHWKLVCFWSTPTIQTKLVFFQHQCAHNAQTVHMYSTFGSRDNN